MKTNLKKRIAKTVLTMSIDLIDNEEYVDAIGYFQRQEGFEPLTGKELEEMLEEIKVQKKRVWTFMNWL